MLDGLVRDNGIDFFQLSPEDLDVCRRKIAFYKIIRPVVQEGDLYRLSLASGDTVSGGKGCATRSRTLPLERAG